MPLYEDASGHVLKRNRRDHKSGNTPHTWCTRCQALVPIHEISKEEHTMMGKSSRGGRKY